MQYSYVAATTAGLKEKGVLEARSEKEVVDYLRSKQLVALKIKRKEDTQLIDTILLRKTSSSDIVLFTRQLASMITSGLTIIESLNILKNQVQKNQFKKIISDLIADVSEGRSLSDSMKQHNQVFSEVYVSLVKAAEAGGILDKVLTRLADNLERSQNMKKEIRSALFYPAIILVGVLGVIFIMNIFVIPQLGELYSSLDLDLPATTRIVLAFSEAFSRFYLITIPLAVGLIFLYRRLARTESGRKTLDRYKLKIPLAGSIIEYAILAQTTRTLSLLISSGTSIIEALNITSKVAGNAVYADSFRASSALVEKGITLSQALDNQDVFPPIIIQMTKVGESTGKIDENLLKTSEYFERDLKLKTKTLTSSVEPILIIVLGTTVGFLILSVITPIYGLISQLQ